MKLIDCLCITYGPNDVSCPVFNPTQHPPEMFLCFSDDEKPFIVHTAFVLFVHVQILLFTFNPTLSIMGQ